MKRMLILILFLFSINTYARAEKQNIAVVKNMFSEFAEKLDMAQFDNYYTKDFVLESNEKHYSYTQYKDLEVNIYKTLKSLTVTKYADIFARGNKVVSRMNIKLVYKDNQIRQFSVILIALIRDHKIARIWEITYPSWS